MLEAGEKCRFGPTRRVQKPGFKRLKPPFNNSAANAMTEEEAEAKAYQVALHRIHVAKETRAVQLDLNGRDWNWKPNVLAKLNCLPPELADLTFLQSLNLSECHVSDLSPLAALTSLQSLALSGYEFDDLTPLAGLVCLNAARMPA